MGVKEEDKDLLESINNYLYLSNLGNYEIGKKIGIIICNSIAADDKDFLNGVKDRLKESL